MGLNQTPSANRLHVTLLGRRNAGKSSLMNAITNQNIAIVSDTKGTTTDPVYKSMELLPLGPVLFIDTPGIDDEGTLGEMRIKKTKQSLNKTDIVLFVVDTADGITPCDTEWISYIQEKGIPCILVYNKTDLTNPSTHKTNQADGAIGTLPSVFISALFNQGIHELKEELGKLANSLEQPLPFISDIIQPEDVIVLVIPIDESAPKGRLILPQQQAIRDILEAGAISVVTKDTELENTLTKLGDMPSLVITDSQAFKQVASIVPESIKLTSFSILMARQKGFLTTAVKSVIALESIRDNDTILIAEGCTHHRQCNDIGTVKLPAWIRNYTGANPHFEYCSGTEFPEDLSPYKMVIHCGGCMLNNKEVLYRMRHSISQQIPFTNYGTCIAYMNGILKRSLSLFPDLHELIKNDADL